MVAEWIFFGYRKPDGYYEPNLMVQEWIMVIDNAAGKFMMNIANYMENKQHCSAWEGLDLLAFPGHEV